jgi:hypothetical protein
MEVYPNLFVGGDETYEKVKDKSGWSYVRACKFGPDGHKDILGYKTQGAPKGRDYYSTRKNKILALNLIDSDDPNFIPEQVINDALDFIQERLQAGDKVLVACNQGRSRGPTIAMLYLDKIKDLPEHYHQAFKVFKGIYHKYDPGLGIEHFAKTHWASLRKE